MVDIQEVNDATIASVLTKHDIVVVDVWAAWCKPCTQIKKILPRLAERIPAYVVTMEFDDAPDFCKAYHIEKVPTFLIFKNGKEMVRLVGITPLKDIEDAVLKLAS